jgi:hypothetical protein
MVQPAVAAVAVAARFNWLDETRILRLFRFPRQSLPRWRRLMIIYAWSAIGRQLREEGLVH